jgi:hypothetical protein
MRSETALRVINASLAEIRADLSDSFDERVTEQLILRAVLAQMVATRGAEATARFAATLIRIEQHLAKARAD